VFGQVIPDTSVMLLYMCVLTSLQRYSFSAICASLLPPNLQIHTKFVDYTPQIHIEFGEYGAFTPTQSVFL